MKNSSALPTFPNIEAFYCADERRRLSGEADFGVHWTGFGEPRIAPPWTVSYVHTTGDVYAVQAPRREGRVILLGHVPPVEESRRGVLYYDSLEAVLDGWSTVKAHTLQWVFECLVAVDHA